jgi:hypothetical protein
MNGDDFTPETRFLQGLLAGSWGKTDFLDLLNYVMPFTTLKIVS